MESKEPSQREMVDDTVSEALTQDIEGSHAYETLMNTDYRLSAESLNYRNDDDLVIEGNAVYEIDRSCYEKVKRNRGNVRVGRG